MEDAKLNVVAGERGTSIEAVQGSDSTTSKAKDERISCFKLFYDWRHCTCM